MVWWLHGTNQALSSQQGACQEIPLLKLWGDWTILWNNPNKRILLIMSDVVWILKIYEATYLIISYRIMSSTLSACLQCGVLCFFFSPVTTASLGCRWRFTSSVSVVLQQWHVLTIQPDDFEPYAGSQEQEDLIVSWCITMKDEFDIHFSLQKHLAMMVTISVIMTLYVLLYI